MLIKQYAVNTFILNNGEFTKGRKMTPISVEFDNNRISLLICKHVNKKTIDLIKWYTAINDPIKYLPDGYTEGECREIVGSLLEHIADPEIRPLEDPRMQFALACILEEEEIITDINRELSAEFSNEDRRILRESLPEDIVEYYESYDNYRDLLLPDNSYLDLADKSLSA